MAKIVFVHGMNHEHWSAAALADKWFPKFISALERTDAIKKRRELLPAQDELELVYWGDMFAPRGPRPALKGVTETLQDYLFYPSVRHFMRWLDDLTKHDARARPRSLSAYFIDRHISQTAIYMDNASVDWVEPEAREAGMYDQVQWRFKKALTRGPKAPEVVIGHSLGSVIAYEGLLHSTVTIPTLITIGSPIGVRHLIYEKLRPPEAAPRSPPNVGRWINVSNLRDAIVVPVPEIRELFGGNVVDVLIQRGNPLSLRKNHRFLEYLDEPRVADVIAEALAASAEG